MGFISGFIQKEWGKVTWNGWNLVPFKHRRNENFYNRVSTDTMKKPARKGFNLILKIASLEENGLTISSIDYTCFCSRETFNKNSPTFVGGWRHGGVNVYLFTPHIQKHT